MRNLILTLLIPGALIWGVLSASASTLVLIWICFQRPYDFAYGFWQSAPVFLIALIVAVGSNVVRGQFRPKFPAGLGVCVLLFVWAGISCFFAFDPDRSWFFYSTYVIPMVIGMLVTAAIINDLTVLKWSILVAAGSLAANGLKTAVSMTLKGGGVLQDQISGFVGDNNVFGLVLCTVVAVLLGMRRALPDRKWVRVGLWVTIVGVMLCIVYTKSRGALLSLGIIFAVASILGGKPIRHLLLVFTVAFVGYSLIPSNYFSRLSTLQNVQGDESAMGRVENWGLAWDAGVSHPMFGVGLGNHLPYNHSINPKVKVRVAHSVYFQVIGELGFFALFLYITCLVIALLMTWSTWREMERRVKEFPDLLWVRDAAFWTFCGLAGFIFGSGLLNTLYIEFPWYMMMFAAMLKPMVRLEIAKRASGSEPLASTVDTAPKPSRPRYGVRSRRSDSASAASPPQRQRS